MAKSQIVVSFCFALSLASCDQSPVETKRSLAEFACLTRSLVQLGYAKAGSNGDFQPANGAQDLAFNDDGSQPKPSASRFQSTGQFVVEYGQVELKRPTRSYGLVCTGDFNAGVLTSVQIDGILYRPAAGERWTF